jgi:hypothetical protein
MLIELTPGLCVMSSSICIVEMTETPPADRHLTVTLINQEKIIIEGDAAITAFNALDEHVQVNHLPKAVS